MKKLFYLTLFVLISGVASSQGVVTDRYDNGKKEYVNIYSGSGIAEKLTKRYYYQNKCNNVIFEVEYFDSKGNIYKKITYYDCSSKIYYSKVYSHKTHKTTTKYYNEDGTLRDGYPEFCNGNCF